MNTLIRHKLNSFKQKKVFWTNCFLIKKYLIISLIISFSCVSFSCTEKKSKKAFSKKEKIISQLKVSSNARYLVTKSGDPVFLNSETAWRMAYQLDTNHVDYYFKKRKDQKFNSVGIVAIMDAKNSRSNVYGSEPFQRSKDSNLFDPLAPIITSDYDFWDHLDYIIDKAEEMNFYVILLPTWGTKVAGAWDGTDTSGIIFNKDNAYKYGLWIGNRYHEKKHIIWMMGGDRSAVYGEKDYREVFRAMAKGVADGVNRIEENENGSTDYSTLLVSYHPRKYHLNSSEWFHRDTWLDFNSIQDWPEDQIPAIEKDYQLEPPKPTWLFEGRYEDYKEEWKDWQVRYQAYQTVFAGGFGHTYGHERIWGFFPDWKNQMDDPGAWQMQHLYKLMISVNNTQFINRIPSQNLIIGEQGISERLTSNRIQATRCIEGSYAFIYSANGRDINVKMDLLASPKKDAYWYNPRNGMWDVNGIEYTSPLAFEKSINSGKGATNKIFDTPGIPENGNDWILVLR